MLKIVRRISLCAFVVLFTSSIATQTTLADESVELKPKPKVTELERFLLETLQVEDIGRFVLNTKLKEKLENGLEGESKVAFDSEGAITKDGIEALQPKFSIQSKYVLKKLIKTLGRSSYNNSMLVGPAGSGKTFGIGQLVAILSYGVIPDFLDDFLNEEKPSQFVELLKSSYLEKTQIISVDYDLLSRDNTRSGKAFAKSDVRMRALLIDLFNSAKADFKNHGIRTIFILEEVATLPPLVQQTLKTLLDETGFKSASHDPLEKGSETGYSVLGVTTPGEYREMVGKDAAVERRYEYTYILESTEAEALEILINKKEEWFDRYELLIEDDVLAYIISMRIFFSNPPQAMPASVLTVMDGLFLWAMERSNRIENDRITVEDAYRYLIEYSQLPKETWISHDPEKPPLWNLDTMVSEHVVGHELEINQMSRRIRAGRTTGFSDIPVFIIMGPSGAGKDTLLSAFNKVLFGHDGSHLNFGVGGPQGKGLGPLIDGSEHELPKLITALNEGSPNGLITLNEAKDMSSPEFDRLKVLTEQGVIQPKGHDSRSRPLGLNMIALVGEYGSELLQDKTDDQIDDIVDSLTEEDLINILMKGHENGKNGAMPYSVVQRAIKSGGIFFLKPAKQSSYVDIARNNVRAIIKNLKVKSQLDVEVTESVFEYVASLAILNKRGTRGLDELLSTFTSTLISESIYKGLPERGVSVRISVDKAEEIIKLEHLLDENEIKLYTFRPKELLTSKCETLLGQ